MKRDIIKIDEEKCNGCGVCITACHEGALELIDGKARLVKESYCDGLGHCLPECPTGAMTIEARDADEFDEEEVKKNIESNKSLESKSKEETKKNTPCGCPGTQAKEFKKKETKIIDMPQVGNNHLESELMQWPCQIKLVPVNAPYFKNANLLVAADCTAFAYANIHKEFMKNKITIIGCPKLDSGEYSEKLMEIIKNNDIKSVSVLRMEVPCCSGIANAVKTALINSKKMIPWNITNISVDGNIVED